MLTKQQPEMQGIIEKYAAWATRLEEEGRYTGGQKLRDHEGRVLRRESDEVRVLDGPYSETKEVLGGAMIIRAESYDEAVRIASDCPHLGYGGTIEIRAIERH